MAEEPPAPERCRENLHTFNLPTFRSAMSNETWEVDLEEIDHESKTRTTRHPDTQPELIPVAATTLRDALRQFDQKNEK